MGDERNKLATRPTNGLHHSPTEGLGRCACGAIEGREPHRAYCESQEIYTRPKPRGDYDLILKHVAVGRPIYVELKNGSRFVGVVLDFTDHLLELNIGLLSLSDVAFISGTSIPHIGLVTGKP